MQNTLEVSFLKNITFKKLLLYLLVVIIYCAFFQVFYNLLKYDKALPYEDFQDGIVSFTYNFVPILFIIILNYYIVFKLPQNLFFQQHLVVKIGTDVLVSFLMLSGINAAFLLICRMFVSNIEVDWVGTILNNILVLLSVEVVYYIISTRRTLQKVEFARREAIQYQYEALKAQVNPHFLFNSLNILYSLVSIDIDMSREFILSLSQMYRYIMSQQNKTSILLSEELEFLHSYISVLEMRYHNQFKVEIQGEDKVRDQEIIPYTLQLLIENVAKHNVISTRYPMTVNIVISDEMVCMSNSIKYKESDSHSGIGLKYIIEQYRLYDKEFQIENDGLNFIAKIPYL